MIRDKLIKAIFQMKGTDKERLQFVLRNMPLYSVCSVYSKLNNIQNSPPEEKERI